MTIDRYTRSVLTVIAGALTALAAHAWLGPAPLGSAIGVTAVEAQTSAAQYEISLPKAWGKVVAYGSGNLLLEDKDGTLREVDMRGKPPEYPRVKVLARWTN